MKRIVVTLAVLAFACATGPALAQSVDNIVVQPQANGHWLRAESDHVIVYSNEGPDVLRRTVEDLEVFDRSLRTIYGKLNDPPPRKYPIYLVRAASRGATENETYRRFMPDAPVTSLYMGVDQVDDIFAVVVRDNFEFFGVADRTQGDDSVLSAYAAHFFSENFPFRQPRWLIKGAAIYYSSIDIQADRLVVGAASALFDRDMLFRHTLRIADVIAEAGYDWSYPEKQRYDVQSALLVRYLWSDPERKARLATYLDQIAGGERDLKAAWAEVFGEPVEKLPERLKTFLAAEPPLTTLPRPVMPPPQVRIRRMPEGAEDLILEIQRLKSRQDGDTSALLRKFRRVAARRPNERYSRQALALAEITLGDRDAGERLLTGLLQEDPGNLEALRLMGSSRVQRAMRDPERKAELLESARIYLRRADAAEPNDYQTLFLLAQTMATGGPPSPERLALLRRAVALAPEVALIRLTAAVAFLMADDTQTAFQLLKPMSADPYGGIAARKAKEVLDLMARLETAPKTP
jgi:hypothetical protein